jgi:hypothetical protein
MNIYSHTAQDRTPFTYIIGWSELNKFYYGKRTAKNCHPSELWTKYFTSSEYVNDFVLQFGNPDIILVDIIFDSVSVCNHYEEFFHYSNNVVHDSKWLNESYGNGKMDSTNKGVAKCSITGNPLGLICSDDPRWKTGEIVGMSKGTTYSEIGCKNISISKTGKISPHKGKTKETSEWAYTMSVSAKEWHSDPERNKKHRESLQTVEYKEKQSKITTERNLKSIQDGTHVSQIKLTCPYCGFTCGKMNAKRHHFENCRFK